MGNIFFTAQAVSLSNQYALGGLTSVSDLFNLLIGPAFVIAGMAVITFFIWGSFKYMVSDGDKNAIDEARKMIISGITGFMLLLFTFVLLKFVPEALGLSIHIIK